MEYVIITDATCDLSPELLNTHGIEIIPMDYIVADETYTWDGAHKDRALLHSFYEHLRKDKSPTSTSQIPPNRYYDAFEPHVKEGRGIIYIALSSGVSNTCESAMAAVNMLKESYEDISIAVIDSLSGSFGEGLLVEAALKNKSAGMGFEDNVSWLREHVMNVRTFVKLEDLMFLSRGGRLSKTSAVIGTALNIKPIMFFDSEGKASMAAKKHGIKLALADITERFEKTFDPSISDTVYIVDTDNQKEADMLETLLKNAHTALNIVKAEINPIVGSLLGPDVSGLVYFGTRKDIQT